MEQQMRDLLKAIEDQKYPLCETHKCTACDEMRDAISAASSALEHSGHINTDKIIAFVKAAFGPSNPVLIANTLEEFGIPVPKSEA